MCLWTDEGSQLDSTDPLVPLDGHWGYVWGKCAEPSAMCLGTVLEVHEERLILHLTKCSSAVLAE